MLGAQEAAVLVDRCRFEFMSIQELCFSALWRWRQLVPLSPRPNEHSTRLPTPRRTAFAAVTGELHTAIDLLWGGMFRAASRPEMARQAADTARRDAVAQRLARVTGGKAGDGRAQD